MVLEICVDSIESAIAAENGGAHRIELCSDLLEGGITPSGGLIKLVRRQVAIDVFVMIRPRGGDFCYSDYEFELMKEDIAIARRLGANGVVLGLLTCQGRVDVERTRELVQLARPMRATFHRAIDMTPDLQEALEDVIATGAERVLTSGGAQSVVSGGSRVRSMVEAARGRIALMAGGGITSQTIREVAEQTGAIEFHASLRTPVASPVEFHNDDVTMGETRNREYLRFVVLEDNVCALADQLKAIAEERSGARTR